MGGLPSTWFLVHPITYDPSNHSEDIWKKLASFNQPCGNLGALPLGEIGAS